MTNDAKTTSWAAGQKAAINRRHIVTVARVTPSGRAVVNDGGTERTFDPDGRERGSGDPWRRALLWPLTEAIEAEIALAARSMRVFGELSGAIDAAERWMRRARPSWGSDLAEQPDVERAERLVSAIMETIANVE